MMLLSNWNWKFIKLLVLSFGSLLILYIIRYKMQSEILQSRKFIAFSIANSSKCSPRNHIMFLKTHKCGTSTLQNIIHRYGMKHNLTFVLPEKGVQFPMDSKFNSSMLSYKLLPPSRRADIFSVHSRLNIPEHRNVVYPNAKWISIVRHPAKQFISMFDFYHLEKDFKMDLKTFLNQPVNILRKIKRHKNLGRNQILYDLGYEDKLSLEDLRQAIDVLDKAFHYVMIADRMDESLILLKNELCWTNEDVVGFSHKVREKRSNTLSNEQLDKISQMNMEDQTIYKHFFEKHILKVTEFGMDKMAGEIKALENMRQDYFDMCSIKEVEFETEKGYKALSSKNDGNMTCKLITMHALPFMELIRNKQRILMRNIHKT